MDFGRLGIVHATGKRRTLHALIVTLVHSRHQYVNVTHTQTFADFTEGMEDACAFGGVPAHVVVVRPVRYAVAASINRTTRGRIA